jgi:hypothetical protein
MSETNTERYERLAEAFYNATGKMAPGKDVSAEMGGDDLDERVALWRVFIAGVNLSEPAASPQEGREARPCNWQTFGPGGPLQSAVDVCVTCGALSQGACLRGFATPSVAPLPPVVTIDMVREAALAGTQAVLNTPDELLDSDSAANLVKWQAMSRHLTAALARQEG